MRLAAKSELTGAEKFESWICKRKTVIAPTKAHDC